MKSKVVGKVSKGEIEVIDKKGFWIKVKILLKVGQNLTMLK